MSLFDNKYYKSDEKPEKLIIFIHGYNGCPEEIDYAIKWLMPKLKNYVLVIPRAPFACEKDATKLQWLSFYKSDPDVRFRKAETSVEDIFEIFNRLGDDFAHISDKMNNFIDEQQKLWNIDNKHTFIMGFSQGAMISIYTALTRKKVLGGCISIAGIIAGRDKLSQSIVSYPPFLVLHGRADATVQYKTLGTTINWLKDKNIDYKLFEFDDLMHRINEEEMQLAADFINNS